MKSMYINTLYDTIQYGKSGTVGTGAVPVPVNPIKYPD